METKTLLFDVNHPFNDLLKPYRFKIYYGGRGSGKSWTLCEALIRMTQCACIRVLCVRQYQNSIQESVYKLLCDTITRLGFDNDFYITKNQITSKTGSTFIFKGIATEPLSIKSLEGVDIAYVEEAQNVTEESWTILLPTIRKEGSEIWVSFNTGSEQDYTYQYFVTNQPPNSIVHLVNYDQNPFFPETLRDEMEYCKETDHDKYLNIWEGKPLKLSETVIFKNKFTIEEFTTPPKVDYRHGLDHGYTDTAACIRCYVVEDLLYIDAETGGSGVELDELPDVLYKIDTLPRWPIYAESADPKANQFLKRRGFNIKPVKKGPNSILDGISYLKSFRRIFIHPRCTNIITEFKNYSWKRDRISREIIPVPEDCNNHYIDALRYALEDYALKSVTMSQFKNFIGK